MSAIRKLSPFLLALLAALLLAGCGGTSDSSLGVPTPQPTAATMPTESATAATYPSYGHADDYSWVAGQLSQQGSCWILTYISPLSKVKPDQYGNHFALSPGGGWDPASVSDGEWVVAQGQPEAGTEPASGCSAHGYMVSALRPNPNAGNGAQGTPIPPSGTPATG